MEPSSSPVLRSEELPPGTPTRPEIRRARAGESEVLLARLAGGEVVAFDARCPHQGTSLDGATVWDGNLRCPRHLYLYDPHTGENVLPAREAARETLWKLRPGYLPVYRVEERDGWIWVADRPEPPPVAYDRERERRPSRLPEPEPEPAPPVAPSGPVEHAPQTVAVVSGQEFEVILPTSLRPGHLWRGDVPEDLLVVVSQCFESGENPCHRVRLRACRQGEAPMRWSYARPWDVEPVEVRSFVVHVDAEACSSAT